MLFRRVVSEIYMDRDPRPSRERPLAADILLSFWHFHCSQPIESLQTIFFETVTEDNMDVARREIYQNMGLDLSERLTLRRRGHSREEKDAFKDIYNESKFGKCARTIVNQNENMRHSEIQVSRFQFVPKNDGGFYFHFIAVLKADSGSHHYGGHGRRQ